MKILLTSLLLITCQLAAVAETLSPGDHAEFPLRPPPTKIIKGATPPEPEKVSFRVGDLDVHGLNRIIEDVQVPTISVYRPAKPGIEMRR